MNCVSPMIYFGLHWSERLRVALAVELSEEQEVELTKLARSKRTSVRLSQRARIVLLAARGLQNKDIAERLGVGRVQVSRWRERYVQFGLEGIERDMPRVVRQGSLPQLLDLVDNATKRQKDHDDFAQAEAQYLAAQAEIDSIEIDDESRVREAEATGQQAAAMASVVLTMIIITVIFLAKTW